MIVIIPLGGMGERFKNCGYKKPKPLINVMGKPILFWLLDNLKLDQINLVVIPYHNELEKYNFEDLLIKRYRNINFKFLKLENQTQGAAESVLKGIDSLTCTDGPILCLDGDNFYTHDIISQWQGENCVFYFDSLSESTAYSFIDTTENMIITKMAEKVKISDKASTGAYGFKSLESLKKFCEMVINLDIKQKNEYYLSNVVKLMLDKGHNFYAKHIDINHYFCLGTPLDVRLFCNNYPRVDSFNGKVVLQPQRYCFDLDNTLVTYPEIEGDYSTVKPIIHIIDFLKYLKKLGHIIIIYTARRMKTHGGNQGKIMADIGKITLETLEKFNIPYDELYFGKPYADYYIDDLAIPSYEDLEKSFGFYKSTCDTRSFNSISNNDMIPTYKKTGEDLSGEIYWYQHTPSDIKDMFPIFINSGSDNKSYVMEKIHGIPFSNLMLSESMTLEQLKHIMNSIERIHNTTIPSTETQDINLYDNYCNKLELRYTKYDYSQFKNSEQLYQKIYSKLKDYEVNNLGKIKVIHGDPVLTNILYNQLHKIKFIDMRGKVGNVLTILGDCYYDWAKLYQSLVGYDEILENRFVSISYKSDLIQYFKNRFIASHGIQYWEYLQYLTASLLYTLIPLHHNHKCKMYYDLISKIL